MIWRGTSGLKIDINSDVGQQRIKQVSDFQTLIADLGCTLAQASIAWCAKNNDVSTIILGASSIPQLNENLDSLNFIDSFDDELLTKIDQLFS